MMSTGLPAQDQYIFQLFYLTLSKNKFKNLIRTSKFKFSFRGLPIPHAFEYCLLQNGMLISGILKLLCVQYVYAYFIFGEF